MSLALGVTILAAGFSSRMGRPKLLLPWAGTSVIGHLISQWQHLGARLITAVCAPSDAAIQTELDRLSFPKVNRILNPAPEAGMFSSIQCAAHWSAWQDASLTHLAVVLGDQPHLREQTLRSLIAFSAAHEDNICLPRHAGHRRHPVFLPIRFLNRLAEAPETNLRDFLDAMKSRTSILESDDPGLALDLDRPDDYQRALSEFGSESQL